MKVDFSKVIELSHDMIPSAPTADVKPFDHSPEAAPFDPDHTKEEHFRLMAQTYDVSVMGERGEPHPEGSWYISGEVFFWTHCGTHVEFPYHHRKDGLQAQNYPIENLIGNASIIDFTDKKAEDAMTLEEFKERGKHIQEGDMVFLHTGLDAKWRTNDWEPYPYVEMDAIKWLVDEKKIKAIGTDATSLENFNHKNADGIDDQPNHNYVLEHNVAMVESLTNLDKVGKRAFVTIEPLKIHGIEACPVRIMAFLDGALIPE